MSKSIIKTKIRFTKRNEEGLHCRFCNCDYEYLLLETSPIKGIVCENCMRHLKDYCDVRE